MSDAQALLVPPANGEAVGIRSRQLDGELLETKEIKEIVLSTQGNRKEYLVRVVDGTTHRMLKVNQNPHYLILYNGQPMATCSDNYVPLFNAEIEKCAMNAMEKIGYPPLEVVKTNDRKNQWRMTATLQKDFEVPVGHFRNGEMFNWGVTITNSYDTSVGVHVMMYMYRQVCSNGLFAWGLGSVKHFLHIEKELKHTAILSKIENGIARVVDERSLFFKGLDEMSKVYPSQQQMKLLLKRLNIRKYEAAILSPHGINVKFDKSELIDVTLDSKVNSEYDVLNALTAMSKETSTTARQFELQSGLMEKIIATRNAVPPA